ncbi:murein L,D-transpeptidase [Tropicimonas sp. IMCC34043]|uniref:L,D-transpeptidase family protein n=1 Tax=Tropicimonas sp. IMCC34043 TaxID=2248760 RepID=UPI000E27AA52|nr:L,D-transpeptidase family protein [Tropicimonas sp. IMCC34043]
MSTTDFRRLRPQRVATGLLATLLIWLFAWLAPVHAQGIAFKQAVAEAAQGDQAIATFYAGRDYKPLFTGRGDGKRRAALLTALDNAGAQGLPASRYDAAALQTALKSATSERALGQAEVLAAKMFLQYAHDVQSGMLNPRSVDSGIVRTLPRRDPLQQLQAFSKSSPAGFLRALPPATPQYASLMAEKQRLEKVLGRGGWGPQVSAKSLTVGQSGAQVVALRNRLIAMEYLRRSASSTYDGALQKAVQQFQSDHGLSTDGVAGPDTLKAVNIQPEDRLGQILVGMERERWLNMPLGRRHILVNIPDYTARVIDNGKETFVTRAVVGSNSADRRTPEFSDLMEFMIINPSWNVPRSITIKEYLPQLQKNPNAASQLQLVDSNGRRVSRASVNFSQYTAATFPYRLQEPPSDGNALGQVKFMFPNPYNIYLHDTPSKSLFARDRRDFSHGCVRLSDPFGFAYVLLAPQTSDPKALFQSKLDGGKESRINITPPVPVHLIYRTAWAVPKQRMNYRDDVYGRDARLWTAMQKAGVSLRAAEG